MDGTVKDEQKLISHKTFETGYRQAWTLNRSQEVGEIM
jgi:hypothetical protein